MERGNLPLNTLLGNNRGRSSLFCPAWDKSRIDWSTGCWWKQDTGLEVPVRWDSLYVLILPKTLAVSLISEALSPSSYSIQVLKSAEEVCIDWKHAHFKRWLVLFDDCFINFRPFPHPGNIDSVRSPSSGSMQESGVWLCVEYVCVIFPHPLSWSVLIFVSPCKSTHPNWLVKMQDLWVQV